MKIDWKQKLSSRKFWAFVAVLAISGYAFFTTNVTAVSITALVTALGDVIAYICAEAAVDKSRSTEGYNDVG